MKLLIRRLVITALLSSFHAIAEDRQPNFIFILSDDIAQGDLGSYGQQLIKTPRLDQLAAEGTRYTHAYCGTSVCAPSRASFFTGLHSGHCPIRGNWEVAPEGQLPLPAETVTIAEAAKAANYATSTFVELSGATPPEGYETDGFSLIEYLKGGKAPERDFFYWELHESEPPRQAARFGKWKAVRNGIENPIEIYDLDADVGESNNLAASRPDLVEQAEKIFAASHRADPNWSLDGLTDALNQSRKEAWQVTNERRKAHWAPKNAKPLAE